MIINHVYLTRMNAGTPGKPDGDKIFEQRHTRGDIISRAEQLLTKQLRQEVGDYAALEEVKKRGKVGATTTYDYIC